MYDLGPKRARRLMERRRGFGRMSESAEDLEKERRWEWDAAEWREVCGDLRGDSVG
jgi:hypothetical protein